MTALDATIAPCALGHVLVARTPRGLCRVTLGDDPAALDDAFRAEFPMATVTHTATAFDDTVAAVIAMASGTRAATDTPLPLDVQGTPFQERVWQALRDIPPGTTCSYAEVATRIGAPSAVRAVGTACGANPVALAIPCHRVVRQDGALGGYRWGLARKAQLLQAEQAH
jgi:AraC family transcriptional regulator of adaptative response/methylated-DNA-[protein]-cysteine methyltransferase